MSRTKSRRAFIETGLKTGLSLPFLFSGLLACQGKQEAKNDTNAANKPLKILILGGTSFLGPHQIAYAISRGHTVSTFTRGKTQPSIHQAVFKDVESLIGDRNDNLSALQNRKWDVVIDNSGRRVKWTQSTAELLKDNCDLYLYTSSTGVYFPYSGSDYKEETKVLLSMPEGVEEEAKMIYDYGIMKANSELAAIEQFGPDRTIVVRPTYMIGPADKTNRFIHWPIRLSKGGEIMVPGKVDDLVQYIDVRDVAEWMIRLAEAKKAGTYNAVGPKNTQNIYSFVEEAQRAFDVKSSFVKINDYDFLKENEIHYLVPWIMPIEENQGSAKINNQKAKANGLRFRPLTTTVKDTYDWWYSDALDQQFRDQVEANPNSILAREEAIIKKWKAQ